jgi:hypothetical protein
MRTYLLIGNCGVGKTWIMKKLIEQNNDIYKGSFGKIQFNKVGSLFILGKYDGTTFEGSDRLSMSVATDFEPFFEYLSNLDDIIIIAEGDRFMNKSFINIFKPTIFRINGTGEQGRIKRGSNQSDRQLKSIKTRVENISFNLDFNNSEDLLLYIKNNILI